MKNPIKNYKFWLKIISAALLIVLGLWILFDNNIAKQLVLIFTGLVFGIFAVISFIPLMRTLKSGKAKWISFLEIVVHLALSVYLFIAAINLTKNPDSSFSEFNNNYYRFFIAFYLYSRAVVYFMCVVLYKEETDKIKFWTHILLMTVACFICAFNNLTIQSLAVTIAVIAFLCAFVFIVDGGMGYNRYRKAIVKERKKKEEANINADIQLPEGQKAPVINDDKPANSDQIC